MTNDLETVRVEQEFTTRSPSELWTAWRFARGKLVHGIIGAGLAVVVFGLLTVYVAHEREKRVGREIEAIGGSVSFSYRGPNWIPWHLQGRIRYLDRIRVVHLPGVQIPAALQAELGLLTNLSELHLERTQTGDVELKRLRRLTDLHELSLAYTPVSDAGLENLNEFTNLQTLYLFNTHITDAGLGQLQKLTRLRYLDVRDTPTTADGRALLRKALPYCTIVPDP